MTRVPQIKSRHDLVACSADKAASIIPVTAHWCSWLTRCPLKAEITGSSPVCATKNPVSEPGADRGPRAGSPRGVVVATGSDTQLENLIRSLPLPVLYRTCWLEKALAPRPRPGSGRRRPGCRRRRGASKHLDAHRSPVAEIAKQSESKTSLTPFQFEARLGFVIGLDRPNVSQPVTYQTPPYGAASAGVLSPAFEAARTQ